MKKNFLILAMFLCGSVLSAKDSSYNKIQLNFVSQQKTNVQDFVTEKTFQQCFKLLKDLAAIQKQRKLTLEEMVTAVHALMFLYLSENDAYSKQLEVLLLGNTKLVLPYSQELLIALCSKNEQPEAL